MKSVLVLLVSLSSLAAQAGVGYIPVRILPQARVLEVNCHAPVHVGDGSSIVGTAKVLTEDLQQIEMSLTISRFHDEEFGAAKICKTIKALQTSGKRYEIIYKQINVDENEPVRMDIKGGTNLDPLNTMYNG